VPRRRADGAFLGVFARPADLGAAAPLDRALVALAEAFGRGFLLDFAARLAPVALALEAALFRFGADAFRDGAVRAGFSAFLLLLAMTCQYRSRLSRRQAAGEAPL
jgi:hypothetical protein